MTFTKIAYETRDGIAFLTLNRPERTNALDQEMLGEINAAMDRAEADADVKAVIVRGAGNAFSSGFDLKAQMEARPVGVDAWRPVLRKDFDTVMRFWHCPKPTIAMVRGACLAGACELALACDMTIASEDAFFGEPELKFGAGIVVMLLPWIVGPKIAKEIILLGEDRVSARRAAEIGMINRVVSADRLEEEALRIARHIGAIDPSLVKETKRALNRALETQGMLQALESALEIDLAIEGAGSADKIAFFDVARREGLRAAIAWRDARFPTREG
ncbi:enoyl-CoA hydratase/isomerase family protein [Xanthobacter sp. YC-JY1]|uniref:enoyl-CoA hydratase/isomerase family protein n=1 Tax=Xanthobacter sp. YC-JY1 TaxID=2419844 RepID=UPI001F01BA0B|nr:enoyl-CoA hydratase-related protein [Xanthobacter sp. YC-JY1]UJX44510.1 enoyl-CoA hydratase/isomerase family protein [Xanthobacter sp. YC-JY1]